MALINVRDLLAFPSNGDNATDTVINGIHFNTTALTHWNYTLYSNNTLSNASYCLLVFASYQPSLFANGTWANSTSCSVPILPLKTRGRLGATLGALFGISIMFSLMNLAKHGQQFISETKRFRLVGRRWAWYWICVLAACGMISGISGIDVDRDYLQDLAIILENLFFFCMGQSAMAAIWEAVRHWGSWLERQIADRDPYALPTGGSRGKMEFYMPLVFYFFTFMSFFLSVPRRWTSVTSQGGVVQQMAVAKPMATDGRFKASAILLCVSLLVILANIRHILYYYKPRRYGPFSLIPSALHYLPIRFFVNIVLIAVYLAYLVASTWRFEISLMKYNASPSWGFCFGYAPCLLIIVVFNAWGFAEANEDKQLMRQRAERGLAADAELGYVRKPGWWSKARGDKAVRVAGNSDERPPPAAADKDAVELGAVASPPPPASDDGSRTEGLAAWAGEVGGRAAAARPAGRSMLRVGRTRSNNSLASALTGTTTLNEENVQARQQKVRSMLDV